MESKTVGWKIVPNTVTNRMVDFSLIHKLIPSRRFRRRCKVMNTVLKRRQGLKTYSQYVKIKTAVLRNLSDDEETDMSDSFTENDYNALYKSNLSSTNYKGMIPNQDDNYFSEEEFSFAESDTDYHEISKKRKEESEKQIENIENQCLKISNLGWQDVIKDKSKSSLNNTKDSNISCSSLIESRRISDHENIENNLQVANNEHSSTCFKESSLNQDSKILQNNEPHTKEKVSQLNTEVTNTNEIMEDITKLLPITDNIEKPIEQINPVINNVNERLQSNENHSETLDSSEMATTENIKLNLTPVLDDTHETKNINVSDANKKVFLDESHSSSSERNPNEQEMSMVKNKNNKALKIQVSVLGSTNQPKDSGIEEDTEEEILDNKSKNHKKERHKIQNIQQDIQTMPSVSNQEDSPITQTDSSTLNDHLLLENHDISNNIDPKNTITTLDKNIINTNNQEKMQKHKLQPTVTCTEIVNRKYKIVSCDTTLVDNYANSELSSSDFNDSKRPLEMEETEQNIEDGISPLTKKRLQQLRRLNLTIESESGLSEDDSTSCNTKNIRDNLLRRSRESPDMSDSEDKNIKSKLSMLIPYDKKLQKNKNSKIEDYERRSTLQSINKKEKRMNRKKKKKSKKSKNKESVKSLGFTEFNNKYSSDKCITNCAVKDETDLNSVETYSQDDYPSHEDSISEQHSVTHDSSFHYNEMEEQFNDENQLVGNIKQVSNEKKTIMHDRPYNLQELMNKDNLIHRPIKPSFTFKDIYEDDIFILDIPSMAFEKQLIGKKIILTEKKLKLGKQKYKVECKDIGNISCVFGRKNPHKLYKTVNIKPTARIIARQKIIRTPLLKSKNRYLDESNCTEDDSMIEENVTSTNRHIEMEHEVPFKKRRYNIV